MFISSTEHFFISSCIICLSFAAMKLSLLNMIRKYSLQLFLLNANFNYPVLINSSTKIFTIKKLTAWQIYIFYFRIPSAPNLILSCWIYKSLTLPFAPDKETLEQKRKAKADEMMEQFNRLWATAKQKQQLESTNLLGLLVRNWCLKKMLTWSLKSN